MKKMGRYIILLPYIVLLSYHLVTAEPREEAIFGLVHNKYSSEFVVFMQNDTVFVPFDEVLSFFKIYYNVNEQRKYQGYINNADSSFSIDFATKEIQDINGSKLTLKDDSWFATDLQIFVKTDLFADIFKLKFKTMFNSLSIIVQSDYELPFLKSIRANKQMESFTAKTKQDYNFPLLSSSSFTLLNGGVLDYNFGTSQTSNYSSYNFSGNVGLELLNGELQYNFFGRQYSSNLNYQDRVRWRYFVNEDWLQSIMIGNIQNMSIRNTGSRGFRRPFFNLRGIQITNENYKMPNVFTDYIVEDVVEPDWTVELYLADQLYDVIRADLNGYYRFEIPITYGMTNIKVKIYGTKGEFITEEKILNIPNQMLVPGELKYSISAGRDDISGRELIEGTLNTGIFDWLSTSVTGIKEEFTNSVYLINQSSVNLFDNTLLNLTLTSQGVYEAGIKLPANKTGNFELYYTYFDSNVKKQSQLSSINFISSFNIAGKIPLSFSIYGSRDVFSEWSTNNFYSTLNFFYNSLNFSIRHNLSMKDRNFVFDNINQNLNLNVTYSISDMPNFLSFLNRVSLNTTTYFDLNKLGISSISTGCQIQVTRNLSINSNYNYYLNNYSSNFRLGVNLNTQSLRSNSSADFSDARDVIITSDVSGSLEFDSQNLRFALINSMGSSNMHGKSSIAVKFFVDGNYNGVLDENEELIPDADFVILDALPKKTKLDNYYIVTDLMPGTKYNFRVKTESLPSNTLIPLITEFAVMSKPYSYESVNIPCQQGGAVEGTVNRIAESKSNGQGGIRVHILGIDKDYTTNVLAFSDGSFFYDGLLPGKYKAYVDSTQLRILNVNSKPPFIDFEIEASDSGNFISNLNFELIKSIDKFQPVELYDGNLLASDDKITSKNKNKTNFGNREFQNLSEKEKTDEDADVTSDLIENDAVKSITSIPAVGIETTPINEEIKLGKLGPIFYQKPKNTFLASGMKKYLDKISDFLRNNSKLNILIEGHSDNVGSIDENYNLSRLRAQEVTNYLLLKGIGKDRIKTNAYGSLKPFINNTGKTDKSKNMRVELMITE